MPGTISTAEEADAPGLETSLVESANIKVDSPASPPAIPVDIYAAIISHLIPSDLASCLRVCKAFHYSAVRRLYRAVTINFGYDLEDGIVKYTCRRGELSCRFLQRAVPAEDQISTTFIYDSDLSAPVTGCAHIPRQSHPTEYSPESESLFTHLSTYTKHLTVDSHLHSHCRHFEPLHMPHLETLRIRPASVNLTPIDGLGNPQLVDPKNRVHTCSLLSNVQPYRLLLGGGRGSQSILSTMDGLWPEPVAIPPSTLRELVIIVDDDIIFRYANKKPVEEEESLSLSFILGFNSLPDTIHRLILVPGLCSTTRLRGVIDWDLARDPPRPRTWYVSPVRMRQFLVSACGGRARTIEFIGLETLGDVVNERSIERGQREIRVELKKRLLGNGWSEANADKRVEGLIFSAAN